MATKQQLEAAHDVIASNAGYRTTSDRTVAAAYIESVTFLISILPSASMSGGAAGEEIRYDLPTLRLMIKDASDHLATLDRRSAARGGFSNRGTVQCRGLYS